MAYEYIDYQVSDGIATVTLSRPEKLNAVNRAMTKELIAVMDEADGDDAVTAVIFTGAGRAFCAGADVGGGTEVFERTVHDEFDMERDADFGGYVSRRFFNSTKVLIAAINGPAAGIGITMTLPMDFRLAADNARFGFVFGRRGIVPEASSSWFLPRLVGISKALEWVYTGRLFDAAEAEAAGLVTSLHPPDRLLNDARDLARELTQHTSAVSRAVSRRMLWQMYGTGTPETAHELDSRGIRYLGHSADCKEGVSAFLEKRTPDFPDRVPKDLPPYFRAWQQAGDATNFLTPKNPDQPPNQ